MQAGVAGGAVAYAVGDLQPTLFGFDRGVALAVLGFFDRVLGMGVDYGILFDTRFGHVVARPVDDKVFDEVYNFEGLPVEYMQSGAV